MGRCSDCGAWNSLVETVIVKSSGKKSGLAIKPKDISEISDSCEERYPSSFKEWDRALGGGLVKGSLTLISGSPGVGKSTLLLQVMLSYSKNIKVLYISGEESESQIKSRANRISKGIQKMDLISENNIDNIIAYLEKERVDVVAIDSVQTLISQELGNVAGTISQIREAVSKILAIAKSKDMSFLIVGHVNKEGKIAGPKILEHMVDTVLEFDGEEDMSYRILRASKNRFGSINEIGIFTMSDKGMSEVDNPSQYFIEEKGESTGSIIVPILEGNRVILIEVQSLVSPALFGMPRRIAQGIDTSKIQIVCAVVEKALSINLSAKDIFFNIPGGIKSKDTSLNLGAAVALISSLKNIPLTKDIAAMGEIGLTGEVRKISHAKRRVKELERLGFQKVFIPKGNVKEIGNVKIKVIGLENISELINLVKYTN